MMNDFDTTKVCYIVGAGAFSPDDITCDMSGGYIIAADAGYRYLKSMGITPDTVVGDFDSMGELPEHGDLIKHPVMKNETDMMLAVEVGWERGYRKFVILGGMGGRVDHTVANFQLLLNIARRGGRGTLIGEGRCATVISNGSLELGSEMKGTISVFCMGERAEGVCESGLLYSLENATLTNDNPLGVSNEFIGKNACISVDCGALLIIYEAKKDF